jgi:uncharacterized phiE125 gp8 family phage protein
MSLKLITPPAVLAISLADMKVDLRETGTDKDAQITRLIRGATERAEHQTGRALLEQEWELILDAFPDGEIELTKPPVISITSVKYLDEAGAEQTLLSTQYVLDADLLPGYLLPAEGVSWPLTRDVANAVRVRFKCGYGATAAAVPPGIVDWIACEVVTQFDNPDQVAMAKADSAAGSRAMQLLDPYRTYL